MTAPKPLTTAGLAAFLQARLDEDEATWQREKAEGFGADTPWMVDRMLRELEAKRSMLSRHSPIVRRPGWHATCWFDSHSWPCADALALAAIWSDHPEFLTVWLAADTAMGG